MSSPGGELLPIADAKGTWAVLWRDMRKGPALLAALVVSSASAAGLVAPWALGRLVDDLTGAADRDSVLRIAVLIAAAALASGLLTALGSMLVSRVGETVLARLREQVVDRVLQLPTATMEKVRTGDLLSRVGDDVSVVANAISTTGPILLQAALTVLLTGVGMFALDWRLGLAGLLCVPVYLLALRWYLSRSAPFYARERVAMGERSQVLIASMRGSATVRSYRLEDEHLARIDDRSRVAMDLSLGVFRLFSHFASRINHAEFVGLTAVLVTGFFLVRGDLSTVGATTAAALYFHRLFNPLGTLVMEFDQVQSAGASLARLAGVAELPPTAVATEGPGPRDSSIEVVGLSHRYDAGPLVLADVSFRIEPGERVAFVGASGAGKTTLAAIVAGILQPTQGSVLLGGIDVRALGEARTRLQVALLSQEVHVFSGPLVEDVRLASSSATDAEVEAALEVAGALTWVRALPEGLHSQVGENAHQLTGAQSQQLAFARLVLADPPVAVLDEATAEAGSAGARELERASAAATDGRTTLIVAHRLTQAEQADRIIVLDQGRIVEVGSHKELLTRDGRYAHLWHSWTGT